MKKPIVLKRHPRLEVWEIIFLVLWFGALIWWFTQDAFGAISGFVSFVLINAHRFLRRVTLSPNNIAVWDDRIFNRVIYFERIVNYFLKPSAIENAIEAEVTVQRLHAPSYGIFSNRPVPARHQEKTFRFLIEPEQTEKLLDYLSAQGAVVDKVAEKKWRETQIILAVGKELHQLKGRAECEDKEQEILRQMEAELAKIEADYCWPRAI